MMPHLFLASVTIKKFTALSAEASGMDPLVVSRLKTGAP